MFSIFTKSETWLSFAFLPCCFRLVLVSCSRNSVFMICRASLVLHCHVLCCYVGVLLHSFVMHLKCYDAVKRNVALFLFCLWFANRASVSGDPYIYFDRNHSLFSVACLVCQVDSMIILSLPEYPYALHIIPCIPCHVLHHVACALHRDWLLFCCLCSYFV